MDDPADLLAALRATRFGPVRFDATGGATCAGHGVDLSVDGPTVLATWTAPAGDVDVQDVLDRAAASAALVSVATADGAVAVHSWAGACTPGAVAASVRTALAVAGVRGLAAAPVDDGPQPAPAAAPAGSSLPAPIDDALEMLGHACSAALADAVRALLLGEREQVTLARTQLDELTGAVLGAVTVFGVGTSSGGGATVHVALASGRVVDVAVEVDGDGIRVEPTSEGSEIAAGLAAVDEVLRARGRRLARIAAAGDALVVATEPIDDAPS